MAKCFVNGADPNHLLTGMILQRDPNQWLFLVPLVGGRWHIIPQLAVYTTYIPLIPRITLDLRSSLWCSPSVLLKFPHAYRAWLSFPWPLGKPSKVKLGLGFLHSNFGRIFFHLTFLGFKNDPILTTCTIYFFVFHRKWHQLKRKIFLRCLDSSSKSWTLSFWLGHLWCYCWICWCSSSWPRIFKKNIRPIGVSDWWDDLLDFAWKRICCFIF